MINIQKLIVETLNGDDRAYEKIYNIYKEKVSKFLYKKYSYNSEHDDDVSEILFKVFQKLKDYDSTKSKFDTWVIMIAKNYMIDKSRKHTPIYVSFTSNTFTADNIAFTTNSTPTFNMVEPPSYLNSPHDTLETSDSLDFISNKISVNDFSMLTMNSEGYSYNEIAKEFNSNESKISNKL
ncbi:unnamed protein product, partial [marine sediment metagenome]